MKGLLETIERTLEDNKECFVAYWMRENMNKNISDYTLVHKTVLENGVVLGYSLSVEKK